MSQRTMANKADKKKNLATLLEKVILLAHPFICKFLS